MAYGDFNETLDLAGGLVSDATSDLELAVARGLPAPHRRLTRAAIRHLQLAQLDLFKARNDPWNESAGNPTSRQMQLL